MGIASGRSAFHVPDRIAGLRRPVAADQPVEGRQTAREIELLPAADDRRVLLIGDRDGTQAAPTHWSFGQLCSLASTPSPASYFRDSRLPTPIIADCLNFNLRFTRGVEDVKLLVCDQGDDVGPPRRHRSPLRPHLECRRG